MICLPQTCCPPTFPDSPAPRFGGGIRAWLGAAGLLILLSGCASWSGDEDNPPPPEDIVQPLARESLNQPVEPFVPDGYVEPLPDLGEKGYRVEELAEDVYFFTTGTYNTLFMVTDEGVILTDPLQGQGRLLQEALAEVTDQPVKFLIYSHAHKDHIGDAYRFAQSGVQIIAHRATRKLLDLYDDPDRPLPNVTFGRNYTLTLGDLELELKYFGRGHAEGNIVLYLPNQKILMYVDVATPKSVPSKNFDTVNLFGQIVGLRKALDLNFQIYVAGHLHRPGTKEEMMEVFSYYLATKAANREALEEVKMQEVRRVSRSRDPQRIIGQYYEAVAEECYEILKDEWKPRLMGFEAFARSHCDAWTMFHRKEVAP